MASSEPISPSLQRSSPPLLLTRAIYKMPSVDLLSYKRPFRVGISGAGPGGLGAALFLNQINDIVGSEDGKREVEIQLFDQARELREVGAVSRFSPSSF